MQVIYLCSSTSSDNENKSRFADAEMTLKYLGYTVLNPMSLPSELDELKRANICRQYLFVSDLVCLLPGWKRSESAQQEKQLAHKLKKKVIYYTRVDVKRNCFSN